MRYPFLLSALLVVGCTPAKHEDPAPAKQAAVRMVAPLLSVADAKDIHSYAQPETARVTHVALDLVADFTTRRLAGNATLDIAAAPGASEIVLDSKGLEIASISDAAGKTLPWALGVGDAIRGQPLTVQLNGAKRVRIAYKSAPDAEALQWLTPRQTAGKKLPFLFSQGEAILNRTWIPTQDSPGIRQTWEARIVAPEPLRVVMSGEKLTPDGEKVAGGRAFRFRMERPVAPYLIAIAAGDIAFRPLGKRTGVYAEPTSIAAAAAELGDTEKMVDAAEALYGPYRWGRYDMIVLPPSFPFGGMENPTLTFLTPTMIAGDKSLVSLIAHELAHSWSGNLVTNATWSDFWLNEGFTVYFEGRIMEKLYGAARADQLRALGWDDLQTAIKDNGGAGDKRTQLHLDLAGLNPDDATNDIAYEKGAAFLRTVERAVGRPRLDAYLRSYFDRHAFQPMTASLFLADIRKNLIGNDAAREKALGLQAWIYRPGLPSNAVPPPAAAFAAVDAATKAYATGGALSAVPFERWNSAERLRFLNGLPRRMPAERLAEMDEVLELSQTSNSEILFAWLKLAIANRYNSSVPALERFLAGQGRRKFVAPLFDALLVQGAWGRPLAKRIYAQTRPGYHSVTTGTVDKAMSAAKL